MSETRKQYQDPTPCRWCEDHWRFNDDSDSVCSTCGSTRRIPQPVEG